MKYGYYIKKHALMLLLLFVSMTTFGQTSTQEQAFSKQHIENIKQSYINLCKLMNMQLPLSLDELTTLNSVVFADWTLTCKYQINLDLSDMTLNECQELMDDVRQFNKENAKRMIMSRPDLSQSQLKEEIKVTGLKIQQSYYDENGLFVGSTTFGYKDFFETE